MPRFRRIAFLLVIGVIFLGVYVYDVAQQTVHFDMNGARYVREAIILFAVLLMYLLLADTRGKRVRGIPKELGRLLVFGVILSGLIALAAFLVSGQNSAGQSQVPQIAIQQLLSFLVGIPLILFAIYTLLILRDLILYKRRKGARRNFIIYLVFLAAASLTTLPVLPIDLALPAAAFMPLAIVMIVVNAFKQNWIVSLSRREKIYSIVYGALLFVVFALLAVLSENEFGQKALAAISIPLQRFVFLNLIFGSVYSAMAFVSTLFHLPTAEEFERKQSELTSLHNLSRLVAQVFDFQDLVNSVTQMTLEVVGASRAWLELIRRDARGVVIAVDTVSKKNISMEQIHAILGNAESSLRSLILDTKKYLVIDDVEEDRRTKHLKKSDIRVSSLVSIPLVSHGEIIGILHATKDLAYGFDQDDIEVLTTFADNVTIAIENSRLISESIERERLKQEIMVARQMQKKLLPDRLPSYPMLELAASWEPSLEVGGDYYDFVNLDGHRLGLVVADVAGKGVSAAFYMAEVKGIFQSLSKLCSSPKELLIRANETLIGSIERRAFISLLYAIIDTTTGTLQLARAGHCPMVYVSEQRRELLRPNGMGLGLTNGEVFRDATDEMSIHLKPGDVCVFYTDGITESRNARGEEYGYERLLDIVASHRTASAEYLKTLLLEDVQRHTGHAAYGDDVTLVVAKWIGNTSSQKEWYD
jgi:sigma-B regulation protein RsbU (phosphoserine phosphatase)